MERADVARQLGRDLRAPAAARRPAAACAPVVAQAASETASESSGDERNAAHGAAFLYDVPAGGCSAERAAVKRNCGDRRSAQGMDNQ